MKKILLFIISLFLFIDQTYATSGNLVKNSIVSCNNNTYGYHSKDKHWHIAIKNEDNSYSAYGDIISYDNPCPNEVIKINEKIVVTLYSCIDGDTAKFKTDKGIETTRFLAIDTPESTNIIEPYGKESSSFTCNKLNKAKKIELEFDSNSDLYDKYDRLLAWIWIDGILLQDEIIKNGYAEVAYLYGDYKYTNILRVSEIEAKNKGLNIWSNNEYIYIIIGIILLSILFITFFLNKKIYKIILKLLKKL